MGNSKPKGVDGICRPVFFVNTKFVFFLFQEFSVLTISFFKFNSNLFHWLEDIFKDKVLKLFAKPISHAIVVTERRQQKLSRELKSRVSQLERDLILF